MNILTTWQRVERRLGGKVVVAPGGLGRARQFAVCNASSSGIATVASRVHLPSAEGLVMGALLNDF